ncbi:hypothetical protein GCM10023320_03210 [Pseudonocardia adelaidensis]|uniref:Glycosyltransferase 2-like domain-containing protein n=2 Tax=Pseudonocardia adelaidensis TaxID=648754 RepID=A0ABP9NDD0_9PSEU
MDPDATTPTVSVLTAAHGTASYLAEMIDSVRAQTDPDWELIIVDDGDSDEVARIVDHRSDPRVRLVRAEYRGLGPAVDVAAGRARGRYYAVVHGDDRLEPTFCERTRAVLDAHPGIDVVCIDGYPFLDDGTRQEPGFRARSGGTIEPGFDHRVDIVELARGSALYYTALIRAEAWKIGGGFTCDTPKVEDLAMFLRMLAAGCDIRVLPEQLAGYRLHADTAVGVRFDEEEYEDSELRAYAEVPRLTQDPRVLREVDARLRRLRYQRAMRKARTALGDSDTTAARRHVRDALQQRRTRKASLIFLVLRTAPGTLRATQSVRSRARGVAKLVKQRAATPEG